MVLIQQMYESSDHPQVLASGTPNIRITLGVCQNLCNYLPSICYNPQDHICSHWVAFH